MPQLNFSSQFAEAVADGSKRQTIRKQRKGATHNKKGEPMLKRGPAKGTPKKRYMRCAHGGRSPVLQNESGMKTPKKGQIWVGDFGREHIQLTRVSSRSVFYKTADGSGWMTRSRFNEKYGATQKRRLP